MIEAKLRVYKEYDRYLNWRNIILHHAFDEIEDICLSSGRQKLECLQEAVIALKHGLCETSLRTILENSADETFSKSSINRICQEVNVYYQGNNLGNVRSSEFQCRKSSTVNEIKSDLVKKTLHEVSRSFGSRISEHISKQIESDIEEMLDKEFGNIYHPKSDILSEVIDVLVEISISTYFESLIRLMDTLVTFCVTLILSVNVNSKEWRKKVASEIHGILCKKRQSILAAILPELTQLCSSAETDIGKVSKKIDDCIRKMVRPHQTECMYTFR